MAICPFVFVGTDCVFSVLFNLVTFNEVLTFEPKELKKLYTLGQNSVLVDIGAYLG